MCLLCNVQSMMSEQHPCCVCVSVYLYLCVSEGLLQLGAELLVVLLELGGCWLG